MKRAIVIILAIIALVLILGHNGHPAGPCLQSPQNHSIAALRASEGIC